MVAGCFSRPTLQHEADAGSNDAGDDATDSRIDSRTNPPRCAAIDRPSLVAYYSFDELTSGSVSDGMDGALDGTVELATIEPGKTNNAAHFANPAANVHVSPQPPINNMSKITVCAWMYLDSMPSMVSAIVADKSLDGTNNGWNAYLNRNDTPLGYRVAFYTPFHAYRYGQTAVPIGQWFHMCTTWDGTDTANGIRLYLNGAPESPGNELPGDIDTIEGDQQRPLAIGRQAMSNMYSFPGKIDELALYNNALTSNEVLDIFDCPTSE